MWGNFAKYLNPTPNIGESLALTLEVLGDFIRKYIEQGKGKVLNIGEEPIMEMNQKLLNHMDFWTGTEDACRVFALNSTHLNYEKPSLVIVLTQQNS